MPSQDENAGTAPQAPRQHSIPTIAQDHSSEPRDAMFNDRFAPGTLLASRYRIVARLGRGGMGEVYRADDLKLGQAVALKFLSEAFAKDPKWLRRFNDEVRIAREVAHPNVCRTYDVVEAKGEHFITMEFVDGEDLSSLLRRIGRLPSDKAVEICRQLCAGLAAAHDRGVLHRDLKPANVMIDGRGRVRITDFGIAALAEELQGKDIRAGTPAYMAPEQLAGESVSVRSDIYSLGLVIYEIFTGKEAYIAESPAELERRRKSSSPTRPSTIVTDIDPLVERVIMRCLEHDPRDRPSSAIAVAAALPGGDPLAMALAAGETPSPEMVAHAGAAGGLNPAVAVTLAAALVGSLALCFTAKHFGGLHAQVPIEKPPEVIVDRGQDILRSIGYPERAGDRSITAGFDRDILNYIEEGDDSPERWNVLSNSSLPVFSYYCRSAREPMSTFAANGSVGWGNPPMTAPGMTRMRFNGNGLLISLEIVPDDHTANPDQENSERETHSESEFDWITLFDAAGLVQQEFTPTDSQWTPPVYGDTRRAWTGYWPGTTWPLRIEAATFGSKPVYFELIGPWRTAEDSDDASTPRNYIMILIVTLVTGVMLVAGAMAFRNLRANRGDRRGATRLAAFVFVVTFLSYIIEVHQPLTFQGFFSMLNNLALSAGIALIAWAFYIALEPYARRYWPQSLISWSRLLTGRLRDPMVGRDLLIGCVTASITVVASQTPWFASEVFNLRRPTPSNFDMSVILGGDHALGLILNSMNSISMFLGLFTFFLILRIILKRQWLAIVVLASFMLVLALPNITGGIWEFVGELLPYAVLLVVIVRYGMLALLVNSAVAPLLWQSPMTLDFSHWWAIYGVWGPLLVLALGAYGFWVSLAGQPLFRADLDAPHGARFERA